MNNYRIFETNEFVNRLTQVSLSDKKMIEKKLKNCIYPQLKDEPHFGNNIKKLINYNPPIWRYRIGKYRIFFIINEEKKNISLISMDHRKDAYR